MSLPSVERGPRVAAGTAAAVLAVGEREELRRLLERVGEIAASFDGDLSALLERIARIVGPTAGAARFANVGGLPGANHLADADRFAGVDDFPGSDGVAGAGPRSGVDRLAGVDGLGSPEGLTGADRLAGVDDFPGLDGVAGADRRSGVDRFAGVDGFPGPGGLGGADSRFGAEGLVGADRREPGDSRFTASLSPREAEPDTVPPFRRRTTDVGSVTPSRRSAMDGNSWFFRAAVAADQELSTGNPSSDSDETKPPIGPPLTPRILGCFRRSAA